MADNKKVGVGLGVMILKDERVLLGKRHPDPQKADSALHGEGNWTMPGGKMDFGESFEEACFRETLEETGVKINKKKIRFISLTNDIVSDAHFVTIGFLCQDFEGKPKVMEPAEITQWHWFPIEELPRPLFPPSEKILKNYLRKQVYNPRF